MITFRTSSSSIETLILRTVSTSISYLVLTCMLKTSLDGSSESGTKPRAKSSWRLKKSKTKSIYWNIQRACYLCYLSPSDFAKDQSIYYLGKTARTHGQIIDERI